jgi:hypothetical protein
MLGHQSFNSLLAGGHFDPPHRAATARTMGNLFEKYMSQQPGPGLPGREGGVGVDFRFEQLLLITRVRRFHRVLNLGRQRSHCASELGVRRQQAMVPQHVKFRWRHSGEAGGAEQYLSCGILERGCLLLECRHWGHHELVGFSYNLSGKRKGVTTPILPSPKRSQLEFERIERHSADHRVSFPGTAPDPLFVPQHVSFQSLRRRIDKPHELDSLTCVEANKCCLRIVWPHSGG